MDDLIARLAAATDPLEISSILADAGIEMPAPTPMEEPDSMEEPVAVADGLDDYDKARNEALAKAMKGLE